MTRLNDSGIERLREGILAKGAQCTELPTEMLAALFEEILSLRAASEWRTDMEGMPYDGTPILVKLAEPALGSRFHVATMRKNGSIVAGNFHYDMPDIIKWKPITPPNSTNTDILASMREREDKL